MSDEQEWELQVCCMGAGYVGGPTMAVIAKQCPKVRSRLALDLERFCRVVTQTLQCFKRNQA